MFSWNLNKTLAMKICDLQKMPSKQVSKLLPKEIMTLNKLKGIDHVRKLHESFLYSHKLYMVMEYAERGNLLNYIMLHQRLSESTARNFYKHILSGLSA